jgi:predicted Zn-dependent protease
MKMRSLILGTTLLGGLMSAAWALDLGNFDFGDAQKLLETGGQLMTGLREITPQEEIEIGRGMSASLLGAVPLVQDSEVQRYVNRVGRWCANHTERSDLPWRFGVLDTDTVNAFAAPGGYIFVTRGLMRLSGSEAELAGVLSHEIGHVLAKHHLKEIKNQALQGALANVATEALQSQGGFNAAPFVKTGMDLFAKGLSKEDEFEADRYGVVIATRAGYEPYGLPRVLLTINDMNPQDSGLKLLTSTHPPTRDRLAQLDQLMAGKFDRYSQQPLVAERYAQYAGPMVGQPHP